LPTTYFTEQQLDAAQLPVLSALLPGMGYNRNMARAVVYGPAEWGGANLQRLYNHQGCGLIAMFVKHWRDDGPVGDTLRHLVEWAQYLAGTGRKIMEDPEPLPHIPSNIIQATCLYMRTIDVTMEFEGVSALPIQRQNDFYLMDWAVHCGDFGPAALNRINFGRLYLHAVTASDITNASGTAVRAEMWWGEHCEAPAQNG